MIGDYSCIGDKVDCYCVDRVDIGPNVTVSQYSFLCTASRDIQDERLRLLTRPIKLYAGVWVCADVYVGPGVTMAEGAVAAARSAIVKDVPAWSVVGGNPAKEIKKRKRS